MTMPPPGYSGPQPDPQTRQFVPQQPGPPQPGPQPGRPPYTVQGPPPGFPGPPPMPARPGASGPPARTRPVTAIAALAVVSIVAVVIGLTVKEDNRNAWDSVHAWGGLAVLGAVLTLAPAVAHAIGLTAQRAGQVAVCGAGALVLFWVLFTLPDAGSNTSLATTVGVAAGGVAAWLATNRDDPPGARPASW